VPSGFRFFVRHSFPLIGLGLLAISVPAWAQKLTPVKVRVAGTEVLFKTPALTDGTETYAPLDVLGSVGALGKVNAKGDAAVVTLPQSKKQKEIALTRLGGKTMLPLSELAQLLEASVMRPNELGEDGKPLPNKPGDAVHLLARIKEARWDNGTLKIVTSFPIPYKVKMVTGAKPLRGYVDCIGAKMDEATQVIPLLETEKRVLRLRVGQNTPETARVVLELADGNALKVADVPLNLSETIAATLIKGTAGREQGTVGKVNSNTPTTHPPSSNKPPVKVADNSTQNPNTPDTTLPPVPNGTQVNVKPNTNGSQTTPPNSAVKPSVKTAVTKKTPPPPIAVKQIAVNTDSDELLKIQVMTTGKARPFVRYERDASELVVDIPNAQLQLDEGQDLERRLGHPLLAGLRIEFIDEIEPMTRITLELPRIVGFTGNAFDKQFTLELRKPRESGGRLAEKVIVIDPGHGGTSSGAVSGGVMEKHLCLAISLKLRAALEALGAKVVMTRDKDSSVALYDRPRLANDIGADLFISIHNDSTARPGSASGTTSYYHMTDPSSRALAVCIQSAICDCSGLPNRGALSDGRLYQNGLAVLRAATMPAVLVEVAYINNQRDRAKLTNPTFQKQVAEAIVRGVRKYVENTPIVVPPTISDETNGEDEGEPPIEESPENPR
jgi:N-acetylmuramoyl-L-alanine amidase